MLAIGIIGLEVDNEEAARRQIDEFWEAYGIYARNLFVQSGAGLDSGLLGQALWASAKAMALSPWVYVFGGVMLAIFGAGLLFATWAPADLLAYDGMAFTSRQLYERTDGNPYHMPQPEHEQILSVSIDAIPIEKQLEAGGVSAYVELREYHSSKEHSQYNVRYRTKRI